MNTALMLIAGFLMLCTLAVFFWKAAGSNIELTNPGISPRTRWLLTSLILCGSIIACGGFWIDWLIWVGIILVEIGCLSFFLHYQSTP